MASQRGLTPKYPHTVVEVLSMARGGHRPFAGRKSGEPDKVKQTKEFLDRINVRSR